MTLLPRTDMHHGLSVAWFAFSCLLADLTTHRRNAHYRKARP